MPNAFRSRRPDLPEILFWGLVLVYAAYCFTVPIFPTGDGAGHVYWSGVLANHLLGGSDYAAFEIRQYLPPYALTSYYLAVVDSLFSGALAEKSLAALCIVVFCAGVRRLALAASPAAGWTVLLIVPFSFHNLFIAGFYNFCLGAGLTAFTAAFWVSDFPRFGGPQALRFLAFVALLYLAHPFALAVGLLFCGLHLASYLVCSTASAGGSVVVRVRTALAAHRWPLLCLLAATPLAWYVTTFVWPEEQMPAVITWARVTAAAAALWKMDGLLAFSTDAGRLVRLALIGAALVLGLAGLVKTVRQRKGWDSAFLFAFAGLMFLLYAWAPEGMITAVLVSQRFTVFLLIFLVASAARLEFPPRAGAVAAVVAAILCLLAFRADITPHRALAEMNRVLVEAPPLKPGAQGAIVMKSWAGATAHGARTWPCLWSASHYFERSRATLINAPWAYERYSMLAIRHWREYWGFEAPRMQSKLIDGLDGKTPAPDHLDLLIQADCSGQESENPAATRLAEHYGLARMPWSTPDYVFYARPEAALRKD